MFATWNKNKNQYHKNLTKVESYIALMQCTLRHQNLASKVDVQFPDMKNVFWEAKFHMNFQNGGYQEEVQILERGQYRTIRSC